MKDSILRIVFFGIIAFILGFILISGTYSALPSNVQNAANGFQMTQQLLISAGPTTQTVSQVTFYVLVPFLLVFTLIWGTLNAGAGRFFPQKVQGILALLFSMTVWWSKYFLWIAAALNAWGALTMLLIGIAGIVMGSYATFHEWSGTTRRSVKQAEADLKLEKEGKKIDNRLNKLLKKIEDSPSDHKVSDKSLTLAIEAERTPLNDVETLQEIHGQMRTRSNDDRKLKQLVGRKKSVARRLEKHMEEELREAERDLKYE